MQTLRSHLSSRFQCEFSFRTVENINCKCAVADGAEGADGKQPPKFVDIYDRSMNIFKFSTENASCHIWSKRRNMWIALPGHGVLYRFHYGREMLTMSEIVERLGLKKTMGTYATVVAKKFPEELMLPHYSPVHDFEFPYGDDVMSTRAFQQSEQVVRQCLR